MYYQEIICVHSYYLEIHECGVGFTNLLTVKWSQVVQSAPSVSLRACGCFISKVKKRTVMSRKHHRCVLCCTEMMDSVNTRWHTSTTVTLGVGFPLSLQWHLVINWMKLQDPYNPLQKLFNIFVEKFLSKNAFSFRCWKQGSFPPNTIIQTPHSICASLSDWITILIFIKNGIGRTCKAHIVSKSSQWYE